MNKFLNALPIIMMCCLPGWVFAQVDDTTVAMADGMRSNGKIYVVVAVLCLILAGIAVYLIRIDRKIAALENGQRNKL